MNAKLGLENAELAFYLKNKPPRKNTARWLNSLIDNTAKERRRVLRAENSLKSALTQREQKEYFGKPIYVKNPRVWPVSVACLDIETTRTVMRRKPVGKDIKCIGIKIFKLVGNYYIEREKHILGPIDFPRTSKILRNAEMILGWNVVGFDYFILKDVINVGEFYGKTADPFFGLIIKNGGREGNGLQRVSMKQLKFGKLKSSGGTSRAGLEKVLHEYNERDLDLTMRCWTRLHQSRGGLATNNDDLCRIDLSSPQVTINELIPWRVYKEALNARSPSRFSFMVQDWLLANIHSQIIFNLVGAVEVFLDELIEAKKVAEFPESAVYAKKIKYAINTIFKRQSFSVMQDKLICILVNMILVLRGIEGLLGCGNMAGLLVVLKKTYSMFNGELYWPILSRNKKLDKHRDGDLVRYA